MLIDKGQKVRISLFNKKAIIIMKASKENCDVFTYETTCHLTFKVNYTYGDLYPDLTPPKVILVPKVYRENGKQYRVTKFYPPILPYRHETIIKAPRGCYVEYQSGCRVEYYD